MKTPPTMRYQEFQRHPSLAPYVCSYWRFEVDRAAGAAPHHVVPDGCVSLVYCARAADGDRWLRILGPCLEALHVPVFGGEIFWGIRFRPGAAGALLRLCPLDFRNGLATIDEVGGGHFEALRARLAQQDEAGRVFETWLLELLPEAAVPDPEVAAAVRLLTSTHGQERIAAVAREAGLSQRQLQRRFREAVGLTPKEFARVQRVRAAAYGRLLSPEEGWAGIAMESGYADQAHLCHEFRELVGLTPGSYDSWLGQIQVAAHAPQP